MVKAIAKAVPSTVPNTVSHIQLSAIQLCSTPNVNENLKAISHQLSLLNDSHTNKTSQHIVVLPECCLFFGGKDAEQLTLAQETQQSQLLVESLATLAKTYQVILIAGTIPLLAPCGTKFTNTSCTFSPEGELLGQYDKIHLFDVDVNDNEKQYRESTYTQAGSATKVIEAAGVNIGLSICFDLRFAGLYQQLRDKGADIITVPSAFTRVTGKAHWQALLQARAIENQVYIIAAAQEGVHQNGRETWGHSMIISPWGEILSCLESGVGFVSAECNPKEINRIRTSMPVQKRNQFTVELTVHK
jgi:predicted amidohydrolase